MKGRAQARVARATSREDLVAQIQQSQQREDDLQNEVQTLMKEATVARQTIEKLESQLSKMRDRLVYRSDEEPNDERQKRLRIVEPDPSPKTSTRFNKDLRAFFKNPSDCESVHFQRRRQLKKT
jgi:chromosome segregation ATPase